MTVQLLVQSPRKFLCVLYNLGTKTYPKFVAILSFFKIFKKIKNWKNSREFYKINKFISNYKKERLIGKLFLFVNF